MRFKEEMTIFDMAWKWAVGLFIPDIRLTEHSLTDDDIEELCDKFRDRANKCMKDAGIEKKQRDKVLDEL